MTFKTQYQSAASKALCAVNNEGSAFGIDRNMTVVGTCKGLGQGRLESSAAPGTRHKRQLDASPFYAQALCQMLPSAQGCKQCPQATANSAAGTGVLQSFQGHLLLSHARCCQGPALCQMHLWQVQMDSWQVKCKRLGCS